MTTAAISALLVILVNVGWSMAAKMWTRRMGERWWGKSQAVAALLRGVTIGAGLLIVWRLTTSAGAFVLFIFAAAIGQMVTHIYLLQKKTL